jgi:hypothetical protein
LLLSAGLTKRLFVLENKFVSVDEELEFGSWDRVDVPEAL